MRACVRVCVRARARRARVPVSVCSMAQAQVRKGDAEPRRWLLRREKAERKRGWQEGEGADPWRDFGVGVPAPATTRAAQSALGRRRGAADGGGGWPNCSGGPVVVIRGSVCARAPSHKNAQAGS